MKSIILALTVVLAGCSTAVPVTQTWPEPPGLQSMRPCPELKKLEDNPQLSDVAKTITHNYTEYYQCVVRLEAWQEWYQKQQLIHKGLK